MNRNKAYWRILLAAILMHLELDHGVDVDTALNILLQRGEKNDNRKDSRVYRKEKKDYTLSR